MEDNIYLKDGVERVIELLKNTFGDTFKKYFNAEVLNIPQDMLPCIMVTEEQGTIQSDASGQDKLTETITIMVVLNKKDELGGDEDSNLAGFKVRKLVKGQDPSTSYPYEYVTKSVMYALRTHISMDDTVINSSITTEFGPNVRGATLATEEGYVTLTIERLALVPSRN